MKTINKKKINRKNDRGFTLVELIVVLVILAILAAILVPALLGYIDRAKEKKELLHAKNCMTMTQAALSEQYAITGDSLTPGLQPSNTVIGAGNVKPKTNSTTGGVYTDNGSVNATEMPWAVKILESLDIKKGEVKENKNDPYCIMFGVGSNVSANTNANIHDKYTIYFFFYMEKKDSTPLWYFNGTWRTTKPSGDEIDPNTNEIKTGDKTGMKLQYYIISNKTGKYPAGDSNFMNWYKTLK
ncbi:MAG TPA: hypothetical protein DEO87_06590 [Lachnospiraceae bacterium]|nr:hypothetical protein [Lachnospiraceae bacterium]